MLAPSAREHRETVSEHGWVGRSALRGRPSLLRGELWVPSNIAPRFPFMGKLGGVLAGVQEPSRVLVFQWARLVFWLNTRVEYE